MTTIINKEIFPQNSIFDNFLNAIRSPATKEVYGHSLKRYMRHLKITDVDQLLQPQATKVIEAQLIDYIMSLRNDGIAFATIKHLLAPLFTFYQLNDVVLNRKKVLTELQARELIQHINQICIRNGVEYLTKTGNSRLDSKLKRMIKNLTIDQTITITEGQRNDMLIAVADSILFNHSHKVSEF